MELIFTMKLFVLLITVSNIDVLFCEENDCNVMDCLYGIQDILAEEKDHENICGKLNKTVQCFWNCFQGTDYDNIDVYSGLMTLTSQEKCDQLSVDIVRHGKCLLENKYDILTCFLDSAFLSPKTKISNARQLTCKKWLASQSCSDVVAANCGDAGVELMMSLQEALFHKIFQSACKGLESSVYNLQVTPRHGNKFSKLSGCMTSNEDVVTQCWSEHISPITSSVNDCRPLDKFYTCLISSLEPLCGKDKVSSTKRFFQPLFSFLRLSDCHNTTTQNYGPTTTVPEPTTQHYGLTTTMPDPKPTTALPSRKTKDDVLHNETSTVENDSLMLQHQANQDTGDIQSNSSETNAPEKHMDVVNPAVHDNSLAPIHFGSYFLMVAIFIIYCGI